MNKFHLNYSAYTYKHRQSGKRMWRNKNGENKRQKKIAKSTNSHAFDHIVLFNERSATGKRSKGREKNCEINITILPFKHKHIEVNIFWPTKIYIFATTLLSAGAFLRQLTTTKRQTAKKKHRNANSEIAKHQVKFHYCARLCRCHMRDDRM